MNIRRKTTIALLAIGILLAPIAAFAGERWVHVRVEDFNGGNEVVKVNVPLSLVESLLPLIQTDELRRGKLQIGHHDIEGIDLRKMLEALHDAPDANFVTVQDGDEEVRVFKENGFLKVNVQGRRNRERVRVTVPLSVVDALLSSGRDELDLMAAIRAIGEHTQGDLVTVDSDEGSVRIWIDDRDDSDI